MDQLFLISYQGTITTLRHSSGASPVDSLAEVASTRACEPHPSWISLDRARGTLYCTEAGMATGKGALKAFSIAPDGTLVESSSVSTPHGAAHHITLNNGQAVAVAYYYAGYVGTYQVAHPGQLQTLQELTFQLDAPGPGEAQTQSRPHQVALDPSHRYLLSPDLGADMVRVFTISQDAKIEEIQGLALEKGSYPRHVLLVAFDERVYMYVLLQELNSLLVYEVSYLDTGHMGFSKLQSIPVVQGPDGNALVHSEENHLKASHLGISPDQRFLLVSSRGDASHQIPSPVDRGSMIQSDSIFSYRIDPNSGKLNLAESAPSGGSTPRHFSLNSTGNKIAIVSQRNGWVSIFDRDIETGSIGKMVGFRQGFGGPDDMGPVCILWDSPDADVLRS
ncbi:putative isomerase YbhE [Thozetella sp. PMI_491]|nr:putative isomerase YbhE [Thozetella sp. PMI_491]